MTYSSEYKYHEKILAELAVPEGVDQLVLSLLGISNISISKHLKMFTKNDELELPSNQLEPFKIEYLLNSVPLKLNVTETTAKDTWGVNNDLMMLSNHQEYSEELERAIDVICPCGEKENKDKVPVTLLIPDSNVLRNNSLVGKETNWRFFNVKTDNKLGKTGLKQVVEKNEYLFAVRLFFAFKVIGLAKSQQSYKNSLKILPKLLKALGINEQFEYVSIKKLRAKRKNEKEGEALLIRKEKLNRRLSELAESINRVRSNLVFSKTDLDSLNNQKKKIEDDLSAINAREYELSEKLEHYDIYHSSADPKSGYYYAIPQDFTDKPSIKSHEYDDLEKLIIPTPTTDLDIPPFETSSFENEPLYLRRMRFMLSFLLPMTGGTAITFHIKRGEFKAPTLILPKLWNDFAIGMKKHNPKKRSPKTGDTLSEGNFRQTCIAALHEGLHHKHEDLMRALPTISNISADDLG